jgi:hypothetical protein
VRIATRPPGAVSSTPGEGHLGRWEVHRFRWGILSFYWPPVGKPGAMLRPFEEPRGTVAALDERLPAERECLLL